MCSRDCYVCNVYGPNSDRKVSDHRSSIAAKTTPFCDIHFLLFFVHFLTIFEGPYFEDSDIVIHQKLLNLIGKPSIQIYRPDF